MLFRKWRPRVSLRLALIVITLISVALAVGVFKVERIRARSKFQRDFMLMFEEKHGPGELLTVSDLERWPDKNGKPTHIPGWKRWLYGDEYFNPIERVYFYGSNVDDETWDQLSEFQDIKTLSLSYTDTDDTDLQRVARFTNLELLELNELEISDAGLAHLATLTKLKRIDVYQIEGLRGEGFMCLKHMPHLVEVDLYESENSSAAIKFLANAKNLKSLRVGGGQVNKSDIQFLSSMQSLFWLRMSDCEIDDDTARELANAKNLTLVFLPRNISDETIDFLRKKLPNCRVEKR